MKKVNLIATLLLFFFFISCNKQEKFETGDNTSGNAAEQSLTKNPDGYGTQDQQIPPGGLKIAADSIAGANPVKATFDWDSKIIKTATLTLEVNDFKKSNEDVYKMVKQCGGYVAKEEQDLSPQKNESTLNIKVPVDQFESLMNALPVANKVIARKISSDDVTGKIVDIKSRLEAKKEMRLKYLEFLKQSKNMKEALQVQAEVNSIQEEMEAAAGQVSYLSHQAVFSTIELNFYQLLPGYKPDTTETPSFLQRITSAFTSGAGWFANLFVGLIAVWPLFVIILLIIIVWKKMTAVKFPANNNPSIPK